jgi:hypothetical protein
MDVSGRILRGWILAIHAGMSAQMMPKPLMVRSLGVVFRRLTWNLKLETRNWHLPRRIPWKDQLQQSPAASGETPFGRI